MNGHAFSMNDGFICSNSRNKIPKQSTADWELLLKGKYGSSDWGTFPIDLVEYAVTNK
jgi:hypothetical protein